MRLKIKRILTDKQFHLVLFSLILLSIVFAVYFYINSSDKEKQASTLQILNLDLGEKNKSLEDDLAKNILELTQLKNEDQYKTNLALRQKVENVEKTYTKSVSVYESLLELKEVSKNTQTFDDKYTNALVLLSQQKYEEAEKALNNLSSEISSERQIIASTFVIPTSATMSNTAPNSGFSQQQVSTDIGNYLVSLVAGDLSSTKVIVDTASTGDCANDCPVLSLADYVSRNGAYAGINGSYFCPASYPSCSGKTNSFDTLLMNKDKTYFNSANNVYSNVPAVVFGGSYIRFVGSSSDWGRDTGIDSMIANQPLTVQGGNIVFGGDGDPKKGSKGARSFVANKGNTVYIGVVYNATVAETAIVLKAMNMENALNLDSGGSTALWSGGYKVGPGRNIPNAILFVKR